MSALCHDGRMCVSDQRLRWNSIYTAVGGFSEVKIIHLASIRHCQFVRTQVSCQNTVFERCSGNHHSDEAVHQRNTRAHLQDLHPLCATPCKNLRQVQGENETHLLRELLLQCRRCLVRDSRRGRDACVSSVSGKLRGQNGYRDSLQALLEDVTGLSAVVWIAYAKRGPSERDEFSEERRGRRGAIFETWRDFAEIDEVCTAGEHIDSSRM